MNGVQNRVIAVLARQAMRDASAVTPVATLESLGLDSLGLVETIFALEEEFDISIPFNAAEARADAFDYSTVGAVVEVIETLIAAKSG